MNDDIFDPDVQKLDKEERQILKDYENDLFKPVPNQEKELALLQEAARNTSKRNKNINIRISERDLDRLKAKALEEGLPYQTLISSVLHKYVGKP